MTAHPRHAGAVIDAHCHFDASTRARVPEVLAAGGLAAALHLWDLGSPPAPFDHEHAAWSAEPRLRRCHVPDLSLVGAPGFERRLADAARAAAALGAVALKVWKHLGLWLRAADGRRLDLDDPRLEVVWDVAAELDLPIVIHVGDPPAFFAPLTEDNPRIEELRVHPDWWYGGGGYPTLEALHEQFEALVAAHPATRFIGAHFGCFMPWRDVDRMLDRYPNYHVDTAAAIADLGREPELIRAIVCRHPDRVLFGTDLIRVAASDMPVLDRRWDLAEFFALHWRFFETAERELPHPLPAQGAWTVTGLDLPPAVLGPLYEGNARRLFKLV